MCENDLSREGIVGGEISRDQVPDDLLDRIDHFVEFAQNRECLERLSIPERYIKGGLDCCFLLRVGHVSGSESNSEVHNWAVLRTHEVYGAAADEFYSDEFFSQLSELVGGQDGRIIRQDQKAMFVACVENVQAVQYWVPSRIGLEMLNGINNFIPGENYLSFVNGTIKPFRFPGEGEGNFPFTLRSFVGDLVHGQVKGSSKVVNGVSNDEGEFYGYGFLGFSEKFHPSCLAFRVGNQFEGMLREEGIDFMSKVSDVMFGPLNLKVGLSS